MTPELKNKLSSIAEELGGTIQHTSTVNSTGRTSEKVTIEYNIKQRN